MKAGSFFSIVLSSTTSGSARVNAIHKRLNKNPTHFWLGVSYILPFIGFLNAKAGGSH